MHEILYEYLMKLPRRNLINLMCGALDEMQTYNGRSKLECIMLAISQAADSKEDDRGNMSYKIKSIAELKRATEEMGIW